MTNPPLNKLTDVKNIENVFIFISDSTRYDSVPNEILNQGVSTKAIAPSTWTASSYPSIISGAYPSTHCHWDFNSQGGALTQLPIFLHRIGDVGVRADTIWTDVPDSNKPPLSIANVESQRMLNDLNPPFAYLEHHKGGHLPYGYHFDECESTKVFFQDFISSQENIQPLYQDSVDDACTTFLSRIQELENKELLEDTLVIFTSDHGELLGERQYGGVYGHTLPMVPELVEVPLVIAGANIDSIVLDGCYSLVDIAPTALSAVGQSIPSKVEGTDLWTQPISPDRIVRSEVWNRKCIMGHEFDKYRTSSAWDANGGYVFNKGSPLFSSMINAYLHYISRESAFLSRRSFNLDQLRGFVRAFGSTVSTYGNPTFSQGVAESIVPEKYSEQSTDQDAEVPTKQLEKLGYID